MTDLRLGPGLCGALDEATRREWLVTDGCGGFAMGSAALMRTRRYHGLLVVAGAPPIGRQMALAGLEPVLVLGTRRVALGTCEWASGAVDPAGHRMIAAFGILDGVPWWRFAVDDVLLEMSVAMVHGHPAVGVSFRLLAAPGPVRLEIGVLCTWRDVHGERFAGPDPYVEATADGFVFERQYRVRGPDFHAGGRWYLGAYTREEAARGLNPIEDLWHAGTFSSRLSEGEPTGVTAWAEDLGAPPPPAEEIVRLARARGRLLGAGAHDETGRLLLLAADQFVAGRPGRPIIVAGYPWFGDWARDTMISYEGIFLDTGRAEEGRRLLSDAAEHLSEGMLANTSDIAGTQFNSIDGTLWYVHALDRHVERTSDVDLAASLLPALDSIVDHHLAGTRFGIAVDPSDGLLRGGEEGLALTWMDARVGGQPVTQRAGKPVEVNALWVNALVAISRLHARVGGDSGRLDPLAASASTGFRRFSRADGRGLYDVLDGPGGADAAIRPNQLLAVSLPYAPLAGDRAAAASVVEACAGLLTPLGLRTLDPGDPSYLPNHEGGPAARDRAYHQGTVWPWLMAPYTRAARLAGRETDGLLSGLEAHLGEWGLGSVSETASGGPPHRATGCPFQAWSVAELIRSRAAR